jgi:hypothetical protein
MIQKWAMINYRNRGRANRGVELSSFSKGVTDLIKLSSLTVDRCSSFKKRLFLAIYNLD